MSCLLEAQKLVAQRAEGPAIGPLDLTLQEGDWVALMGPNGGGKTTLLRALLGLDAPCEGSVRYAGGPLPSGGARLQLVSALLQEEARTPLTVRELVSLGFGHTRTLAREERVRVDEVLERLGLCELANVPTSRVSGGEWQRARLARTMVPRPRVLVLDEPTNHLDPETCPRVLATLRDEMRFGALLCATHAPLLANACQRVLHVQLRVFPVERARREAAPWLAEVV